MAYLHNPVGQEKEVSLKNRLEKKEPLVKLVQLCVQYVSVQICTDLVCRPISQNRLQSFASMNTRSKNRGHYA